MCSAESESPNDEGEDSAKGRQTGREVGESRKLQTLVPADQVLERIYAEPDKTSPSRQVKRVNG